MATDTTELQLKLRVQEKMLNKQAEREEKNATKERSKAKAALKKGERNFATLYVTNALKSEKQALFLQQNAARLSSMVADLRMAEVQSKMAKTLENVVRDLEKSVSTMNLEQIAATTLKMDAARGKANAVAAATKPEEVTVDQSSVYLNELEDEILAEETSAVPITPVPAAPETEHPQVAAGSAA